MLQAETRSAMAPTHARTVGQTFWRNHEKACLAPLTTFARRDGIARIARMTAATGFLVSAASPAAGPVGGKAGVVTSCSERGALVEAEIELAVVTDAAVPATAAVADPAPMPRMPGEMRTTVAMLLCQIVHRFLFMVDTAFRTSRRTVLRSPGGTGRGCNLTRPGRGGGGGRAGPPPPPPHPRTDRYVCTASNVFLWTGCINRARQGELRADGASTVWTTREQ
jgi:hypothetical protein